MSSLIKIARLYSYTSTWLVACPSGWIKSGKECYYTPNMQKTFANANTECNTLTSHGELAEIRDRTSKDAVLESISKASIFGKFFYAIILSSFPKLYSL